MGGEGPPFGQRIKLGADSMPSYCEVALPVPLDHTFTYGVRLGQEPQRGARVIAPFRNEKLIGVVTGVDVAAPPPEMEVRYLEAVLDEEPLLGAHLLDVAAGGGGKADGVLPADGPGAGCAGKDGGAGTAEGKRSS